MGTTDAPPRVRRSQAVEYLLAAGPACPSVARAGVVVGVVQERYAVVRVSAHPPVVHGADYDVLVHRAGSGWVGLATIPEARGGWVAAVAYALRNPEPDGAPPCSMSALVEDVRAAERRLGQLDDVAAALNRACELPRPAPGGPGPDAVDGAVRAVELEAMKAHACIQRERQTLRDRLDRLEGAIVDREALLTDLGHALFDLRCRGVARRDAEQALVAAYQACAVAGDVDILEDSGAFSAAAAGFLRGVVAWGHVRPLVARCLRAAPTQRAA